jgi:photoactive yellow protein
MSSPVRQMQELLGLFELDTTGNVLYSSIEGANGALLAEANITGRNFFGEVAPFTNVEEFHRRFDLFRLGDMQATSFDFDCNYGERSVRVKVLMARLRAQADRDQSLLVHLRRTDGQ